MEPAWPDALDAARRDELNRLIIRRVRIGLAVILPGILISLISDHALMPARPGWSDAMDVAAMALVALAFWLSGRAAVRAHPVAFALAVVASACGMRAAAGIWFGDLAQIAILCVSIALTAGATLPWGIPEHGAVLINELVRAVNNLLYGCGVFEILLRADPARARTCVLPCRVGATLLTFARYDPALAVSADNCGLRPKWTSKDETGR